MTNRTKGLILITGSTGQGKTTTMSAMIDAVNHRERKHIITIEDPIEAVHENDQSVVRQREVGKDTASFPRALRAALRQDPDIIAVGEMRDYETIRIALTAAETGVLVLSTLHVISIDKIIERLISYSPPEEEGHIRNLLADTLQAIVHQELIPTIEGKKRVATEILIATDAVRNIIRRRGTFLLRSIIQTGTRLGMRSMVQSIREMLEEGSILPEVAEGVMVNYAM
jgi:twitching motility protein PilT